MMTSRIIRQCQHAAGWFSRRIDKDIAQCDVRLLMPTGDPLGKQIGHMCPVLYGSERDVLSRYFENSREYDYVVRITGDCPWTSARVITKHVREALRGNADYTSNVLVRTFPEGQDTEVLSRAMLTWLHTNAIEPDEREHVTLYISRYPAKVRDAGFKLRTVFNEMDLSDIKTSVDTQAEYDDAAERFKVMAQKRKLAFEYGTIGL